MKRPSSKKAYLVYYRGVNKRPVVAAAIVDSLAAPTTLLCAARSYPPEVAGQFELPGGKVEVGEDPGAALAREIAEELGTELTYGAEIRAPDGDSWPIREGRRMRVWLAQVAPCAPEPVRGSGHSELLWVPFDEVDSLEWLIHDLPIVEAVRRTVGR